MEEKIMERLEISEKRRKQLKKIAIRERKIKVYMTFICLFLTVFLAINSVQLYNAKKQIESYQRLNAELQGTIDDQHTLFQNASVLVQQLDTNIVELYDKNEQLKKQYNSALDIINYYNNRTELYNKYEYALIYNGERTDIDYEVLESLEHFALESEYGNDVLVLSLALAMTESHGIADAKNPNSSARGLGQLIHSTAKTCYEDLLGNGEGTYKVEYAFDPETNLRMTLALVNELSKENKGNPIKVIDDYRGLHSEAYISEVRKYVEAAGYNLSALNLY